MISPGYQTLRVYAEKDSASLGSMLGKSTVVTVLVRIRESDPSVSRATLLSQPLLRARRERGRPLGVLCWD